MATTDRIVESVKADYAEGVLIESIGELHHMTAQDVLMILREYKESCTFKRNFTDEFKIMIAERDMNEEITRSSIADDLQINPNTIKRACENFGNALKEKAQSAQEFTRIDGLFSFKECPSCKSQKVNKVDEHTLYCMVCGDEHIFKFEEEYILKVNYEWFE